MNEVQFQFPFVELVSNSRPKHRSEKPWRAKSAVENDPAEWARCLHWPCEDLDLLVRVDASEPPSPPKPPSLLRRARRSIAPQRTITAWAEIAEPHHQFAKNAARRLAEEGVIDVELMAAHIA